MCEIADCNIIEVGYTVTNNNAERIFNRNVYITYKQFSEFFKTHSCVDTYCSAYLYSNQKIEEAELYGNLYLDFDDADNFEYAREDIIRTLSFFKIVYKIPNDQLKIYFSGHKGFHLIVPKEILGVEPNKNLNGIFKTIAEQVKTFSSHKTVDLQIYDNKRLFRVPNSMHSKTNLYKIILTPQELRTLTEDQIKDLAKQPRFMTLPIKSVVNPVANNQYLQAVKLYEKQSQEKNIKSKNFRYKKKLNIVPKCIENILENGAEEGCRNITIACLTSFYKESGKTLDEIIDLLTEWNSRNSKPTPIREMKSTIKSIFFSEKTYGCSTLQTLTVCNKNDCKLIKQQNNKRRNVAHAVDINKYSRE